MAHLTVVLNPTSGRGTGARRRTELERLLAEASAAHPARPTWEIVETTGPDTAGELARQAARADTKIVAAAGGDGTLNEVANGLVGTGATLGLLPLGTGNDFARCVGIGLELPLAARTLFFGTPRPVDLGLVNGRHFLNIAGCGFDAVVADRINRGYRSLRGTAAYLAAVVETLFRFRAAAMSLTLDGETREVRAMLCSVANATSYGGGMLVAPDAQIDDGLFDVCLIHEAGKIEFLLTFPKVFKGQHVSHPKVEILRARRVRVECVPPVPMLIDGEVRGVTPVEFEIVPHAIMVMAPPSNPTGAAP